MKCPTCNARLEGLGTYCYECAAYTVDMGVGGTTDTTPPKRDMYPLDDRLESEIQRGVVELLRTLGYHVSDMSQDRETRQTPGIPDLFVMGHGRFAWVEMKRPTTNTTQHQREWHAVARKNGVPCYVWRAESDALDWHQSKEVAA